MFVKLNAVGKTIDTYISFRLGTINLGVFGDIFFTAIAVNLV